MGVEGFGQKLVAGEVSWGFIAEDFLQFLEDWRFALETLGGAGFWKNFLESASILWTFTLMLSRDKGDQE